MKFLSAALALLAAPVYALDADSFGTPVAMSVLSSTIADATFTWQAPAGPLTTGGNVVSNVSTSGLGITGIVQNTGTLSNVQQTITVSVGQLNFTQTN